MVNFVLPWEEEEVKRVIDLFGCTVMSIEPMEVDNHDNQTVVNQKG